MAIALGFTGWWMYVDVLETPQAVVACVIIYNAAFGYRFVYGFVYRTSLRPGSCYAQLGSNSVVDSSRGQYIVLPQKRTGFENSSTDYASNCSGERSFPFHRDKLGL